MAVGIQAISDHLSGDVSLASEKLVMFAQGQTRNYQGKRSTADRDYVYARKDIRRATSKYLDSKGYFFKIWTLYVRSPDIMKHSFKNKGLHAISGRSVSKVGTKCSIEVEK